MVFVYFYKEKKMEEKEVKKFIQKMKDSKQLPSLFDAYEPEILKSMLQSLVYNEFTVQEFSKEEVWSKYFDLKNGFLLIFEGHFKVSTTQNSSQDNNETLNTIETETEMHEFNGYRGAFDTKNMNLENCKIVNFQALKTTKTLFLPDKFFDSFFGDNPSILKKYHAIKNNAMFEDCDRVEIVNFAKNCKIKKFSLRQPIYKEGTFYFYF